VLSSCALMRSFLRSGGLGCMERGSDIAKGAGSRRCTCAVVFSSKIGMHVGQTADSPAGVDPVVQFVRLFG